MPADTRIRDAALNAVAIAAQRHQAAVAGADRVLAYYLRGALAHGLTVDEVCATAQLDRAEVLRLTDPAVCG